ncbi:MAG: ATP-binding protein [Verrucomicrobia bacterium]|nr:ATP-binding protein [Verrucomicrobiota bacterium]
MKFINRQAELKRLETLLAGSEGALGVLWGRRRIGKTRLLLEWCRRHGGLYTVADLSAPAIQRRYLAEALAGVFKGFDEVAYPDWRALLDRLAREAAAQRWRGPLVFDEFPYWVSTSPDLPSVLQRWLDHEGRVAGLVVVLAGSSQRMMQGLVLDASAPLYGRAREALSLLPLGAGHIGEALDLDSPSDCVRAYAMWGGVPRYWELAAGRGGLELALDANVLDPAGPLHSEPDRLLIEEMPSATVLRPVLDAVGMGAHKVTEVAGRIGCPPTALSRALTRLQDMGLLARDIPFGETEKSGKRALYRISDPFFRMWFRLVASQRAYLAAAPARGRLALWRKFEGALVAEAWEDLFRASIPRLAADCALADLGPWLPPRRFWRGDGPEWDLVSRSVDGKRVLLGEAKWQARGSAENAARDACADLLQKGQPPLPELDGCEVVRVVAVAAAKPGVRQGVHVLNAEQILGASRDG